jgi:hypothetical protein
MITERVDGEGVGAVVGGGNAKDGILPGGRGGSRHAARHEHGAEGQRGDRPEVSVLGHSVLLVCAGLLREPRRVDEAADHGAG